MIEDLRDVLAEAGIEPDARELRDALWLAEHVRAAPGPVPTPVTPPGGTPPVEPPVPGLVAEAAKPSEPTDTEATGQAPAGDLYAAGAGTEAGELRGMATRSPAVPALPHQLDLARALRPLKRRVPSRTRYLVDEEATAAQVAEEGFWLPVLRPAPERWLDLTIVVDAAPSMVVWRRTVAELRTLTERLGAFRVVRTAVLDSSANPAVSGTDLVGRTAVLVVTDAVGEGWRGPRLYPLLGKLATTAPVAVVTLLPQRMWTGTGLRYAAARLHAPTPGLASGAWNHQVRRGPTPDVPIPVVELSARWLASWARLVAGGPSWTNAAILTGTDGRPNLSAAAPESAAEIVARFRSAASPTAFQLACYLSAAWLNLPVMRLVQRVMLPESDTAHLAEVFLGGLLRRLDPDSRADPELVQYEFVDGVRDALNKFLVRDDLLTVLRQTSEFVSDRFGQSSLDFDALLADPDGVPLPALAGGTGAPLARVAASVLAKLGGQYRSLATRLATPMTAVLGTATETDSAGPIQTAVEPPEPIESRWSVPTDLLYTTEHEWVRQTGERTIQIGITDFAQDQLGDIVYIQLPDVDDPVTRGEPFGEIESVKAVSDLYAPVSGIVTAVNNEVTDAPELANSDPYATVLVEIECAFPAELDELLTPHAYAELTAPAGTESVPAPPPGLPDPTKVYLSYANEDTSAAQDLAERLISLGATVHWWHDDAPARRSVSEFESAMAEADLIVVLMSPAYLSSTWCRRERDFAIQKEAAAERQQLYVAMVADTPHPEAGFLINYSWLDLTPPIDDTKLDHVCATLGFAVSATEFPDNLIDSGLPDPLRSRVLLISEGAAGAGDMAALHHVLTDPELVGLHQDSCRVLVDVNLSDTRQMLAEAIEAAEDFLLIVHSGQLGPEGRSGLDLAELRRILSRGRARVTGLIVDDPATGPASWPPDLRPHQFQFEIRAERTKQLIDTGLLARLARVITKGITGAGPVLSPFDLTNWLTGCVTDAWGDGSRFALSRNAAYAEQSNVVTPTRGLTDLQAAVDLIESSTTGGLDNIIDELSDRERRDPDVHVEAALGLALWRRYLGHDQLADLDGAIEHLARSPGFSYISGPDPAIAHIGLNLARALLFRAAGQGPTFDSDLTEAVEAANDALRMYRHLYERDPAEYGSALNEAVLALGGTAAMRGDHELAADLFTEATDRNEQMLGPNHKDTVNALANLALSLQFLGRDDEAVNVRVRILQAREHTVGPDHPDTLDAMGKLAAAYQSVGQLNEAIDLLERVVAARGPTFRSGHPRAVSTAEILAGLYESVGRRDDAQAMLAQAGIEPDEP